VAEALTNVAKQASAGHAEVVARIQDAKLRIEVRDDGVGGARQNGTGLVGLADRLDFMTRREICSWIATVTCSIVPSRPTRPQSTSPRAAARCFWTTGPSPSRRHLVG
jgi:hypothetical protein